MSASTAACPQNSFVPDSALGHSLAETLNRASEFVRAGLLPASVDTLRAGLNRVRAAAPSSEMWRALVNRDVRPHPVLSVAHENPFVRRCYAKPRGYAGDAVMLDFIYRHAASRELMGGVTPRGRALMDVSLTTPAPRAVRNRCRLLADEIDAICLRDPSAEMLALACGHLREAEHSSALAGGAFGRFVALDQDGESVATVARDYGALGIEAVNGSVKTVIARGARELGRFDFIYAAGLYDYLSDRVGARLLAALFAMLKPHGKLWIANFAPDIADAGFMEALMDWWLIYRDAAALRKVAETGLGEQEVSPASIRTFEETERNVVFLEVVKA